MQISHPLEAALSGQTLPENRKPFLSVEVPPLKNSNKNAKGTLEVEKGVHRIMAYMYASGATYKRIAEETGYSAHRVGQILATDTMRTLVAELLHNEFSDDISQILKAGALEGVQIIREIANDPEAPKSVRLKASDSLLDRYRGRATQFVHHSKSSVPIDPSDEIERLQSELEKI